MPYFPFYRIVYRILWRIIPKTESITEQYLAFILLIYCRICLLSVVLCWRWFTCIREFTSLSISQMMSFLIVITTQYEGIELADHWRRFPSWLCPWRRLQWIFRHCIVFRCSFHTIGTIRRNNSWWADSRWLITVPVYGKRWRKKDLISCSSE